MREKPHLLFLYALQPVHPGGGEAFSAIDQPIQRQTHTGFPLAAGSGIKGALREAAYDWIKPAPAGGTAVSVTGPELEQLFGPPPERASDHAGAVSVPDGNVLLFPVLSAHAPFVWVTAPLALATLRRDLDVLGATMVDQKEATDLTEFKAHLDTLLGTSPKGVECVVGAGGRLAEGSDVVVRDLLLKPVSSPPDVQDPRPAGVDALAVWLKDYGFPGSGCDYWKGLLADHLIVVSDEVFGILTLTGTVIQTRIRIDAETGTVQEGALWVEEHLPPETLLWSLLSVEASRKDGVELDAEAMDAKLREFLDAVPRMSVGGMQTVGRGLVQTQSFPATKQTPPKDGKALD